MKVKLISSQPLIETSKSQIITSGSKNSKIFGFNRRQFIKLTCAATIGFTIPTAKNIFYPDKADAQWQWVNLIPIFLAAMEIGEKIVQYGRQFSTRIHAVNNNHLPQQGNIGTGVVRLIASQPIYPNQPIYQNRPVYQSSYFIDTIPPYTRNIYQIDYPSGPYGQNLAIAASQVNRMQSQFRVI